MYNKRGFWCRIALYLILPSVEMSIHRRLSFSRNRWLEKSNSGTYRHHIWFVISGSLLLWFIVFYFNSVAYESSMNKVQLIVNSIMSPSEPTSVLDNDNTTRISPSFQMENENQDVEQIHVVEGNAKIPDKQVSSENNNVSVIELLVKENRTDDQMVSSENNDVPVIELPVKENRTDDQMFTSENRDVPIIRLPVKENRTDDKIVTSENGDEPVRKVVLDEENRKMPIEHDTKWKKMTEPVQKQTDVEEKKAKPVVLDPCSGKYVYVHDLPPRFNTDMLNECRTLNLWADMCPYVRNSGLGQRIGNSQGAFIGRGWFTTDQFTLDVIFHNRMKQYKCLTNNSTVASAIFVPFYAGLDITRYLWGYNTSTRDAFSLDLFKWLTSKPEWEALGGRDHFLVAGRISWDFRRITNDDSHWGNKLMELPEAKNMSLLVLEKSPWHRNDFAIPYPTYFHPSSDVEVSQWQNRMRKLKKKCLFSFAGAPRPNMNDSIRGQIIHQCQTSKNCKLLDCSKGARLCYKPSSVMKLFQSSHFCLQPPGDSFTRKSAFDSILAGCIPVFFHPGSAYVQYIWHLPKDYTKYSVLMSENDVRKRKVNIDSVLSRIPKEKVTAMREEVIRLIPKVIYADPKSNLETFEDAFDISVKGVIERVNKVRMEMRQGKDSTKMYKEENSWKYNLFGTEEKHEWDYLFRKPGQ